MLRTVHDSLKPGTSLTRPRERLRLEGVEALSVVELLALVLRTGTRGVSSLMLATELLRKFETLERLAEAGDAGWRVAGIGPAKIASMRAAFELGARLAGTPLCAGVKLQAPEQVYAHFGPRLRRLRQERFFALLLDSRHRLIRQVEVSRGSLSQSLVHPREVFAPALRESAAALIVMHNHPSGDPHPSRDDIEVTQRLAKAGEVLGVGLLDHIVVGAEGFHSFARSGQLSYQATKGSRR